MTKPFPCCSCTCTNCPDFDPTDDWLVKLCSVIQNPTGWSFDSSSTGNGLHTDLNAAAATAFNFNSSFPASPEEINSSAYPVALLPGKWYRYNRTAGSVLVEFTNIVAFVQVFDRCGKCYLAGSYVAGDFQIVGGGGSSAEILWYASGPGFPVAANCGAILSANYTAGVANSLYNVITSGSIKAQLDTGSGLTC